MSSVRIFLPPEKIKKEMILEGKEARYLKNILRLGKGEKVEVLDGRGKGYVYVISKLQSNRVFINLEQEREILNESPLNLILGQAILKRDSMEIVIQKATELGVKKIYPLITARTQLRFTRKLPRWRKIVQEAARQSGRGQIPEIPEVMKLKDFLRLPLEGIVLWEGERRRGLRDFLKAHKKKDLCILVGPEGGFLPEEIKECERKGFLPVSLGPRILRAESVPLAVLSILQYEWGDLGRCEVTHNVSISNVRF